VGRFQIVDGLFHIDPGGGLGQNSPDHHLKRLIGGPPVLGPIAVHESVIDVLYNLAYGLAAHLGTSASDIRSALGI